MNTSSLRRGCASLALTTLVLVGAACTNSAHAATLPEVAAAEVAVEVAKDRLKELKKGLSPRDKAALAVIKAQAKLAKVEAKGE